MEEKYIKFYKTFHKKFKNDKNLILCSKTLCDGRVETNGALKRKNYGYGNVSSNRNNRICICNSRTSCICSFGKINKNLKRKSNFGRGLQRRVMHQTNLLSDGGVEQNRE